MELDLAIYEALCATRRFYINGRAACSKDFGDQRDESPHDAEDYSCGNMRFTPKDPSPEVLAKYEITKAEYMIVAGQLEAGLSFGSCGLCV